MLTDLKTSVTWWMEAKKEVNQVEWEQLIKLIKLITTEEVKQEKPDARSSKTTQNSVKYADLCVQSGKF